MLDGSLDSPGANLSFLETAGGALLVVVVVDEILVIAEIAALWRPVEQGTTRFYCGLKLRTVILSLGSFGWGTLPADGIPFRRNSCGRKLGVCSSCATRPADRRRTTGDGVGGYAAQGVAEFDGELPLFVDVANNPREFFGHRALPQRFHEGHAAARWKIRVFGSHPSRAISL